MKNVLLPILTGLLLTCIWGNGWAQLTIIADMDTSFANGGKVETSLSGYGDEITDFYGVFPDQQLTSKITVCGKSGTSTPGLYKLGMIQLNPKGTFDPSFGTNGKVMMNWGISDYPNRMYVNPIDSSIVMAGMSASSVNIVDHLPALFKFKKNGVPDSGFGGDGHIAVRFDSITGGEFTNIYAEGNNYLACGAISNSFHLEGFCAMRFFPNGKLDSSFGSKGKAFIPVNLSSVLGFLTTNDTITFIGVAAVMDSEPPIQVPIVFGRMTPQGKTDSTFGKAGVVISTVLSTGVPIIAATQPNYQIVAAIPPFAGSLSVPFEIVRFSNNGAVDSSYGTNGFVTVHFSPGVSEAKGINIAKNGKAVVNGWADNKCATVRLNPDGSPDITFNQIGRAKIDIDSGAYSNYLLRFVGIGNKRYIGVGSSIHNGISQFLVARFRDDTLQSGVAPAPEANNDVIKIYPNPASSGFTIETPAEISGTITIVDALGRDVQTLDQNNYISDMKSYLLDASKMPDGIYYCLVQKGKEKIVRKFMVMH